MIKIGIIGFGEIGSSINKIYSENTKYYTKIIDPKLNYNQDIKDSYILNICIPYNNNFVNIVNNYIKINNPKITIIHSTVAPGTTKQIIGKVCHSPVRGLHPNIDIGIKTFLKYIGSENLDIAKEYSKHLEEFNIKSFICKDTKTSEYAKLLDTTYYGVCIAFHAEIMSLCEKESLDFEEVMTLYNHSYNDGYKILNKNNVIRPILSPTKKIGGHCVVPNAEILQNYLDSDFLNLILKYR
jgi:UDP-N-acetyl-D-mannosaminuronate dehydrogenase